MQTGGINADTVKIDKPSPSSTRDSALAQHQHQHQQPSKRSMFAYNSIVSICGLFSPQPGNNGQSNVSADITDADADADPPAMPMHVLTLEPRDFEIHTPTQEMIVAECGNSVIGDEIHQDGRIACVQGQDQGPGEDKEIEGISKQLNLIPGCSSLLNTISSGNDEDVSPEEFAFAIDHILEDILHPLDIPALLNSRRVSNRWRKFATEKLRDKLILDFWYEKNEQDWTLEFNEDDVNFDMGVLKLQDLTSHLKLQRENFPCTKFKFHDGSLCNPKIKDFLNTYGDYIREISLMSPKKQRESVFIQQIENLLCVQAPNIQNLRIFHEFKIKRETSPKKDSQSQRQVHEHGLELLDNPLPPKNYSLKSFHYYVIKPNHKLVENIIELYCPNLKEIRLHCSGFHFLLEPTNRIYLLQEFEIENGFLNFQKYKMIERAIGECSGHHAKNYNEQVAPIKFTKLWIDFDDVSKEILNNLEFKYCILNILNMILEHCSTSLREIVLLNLNASTIRKIQWPGILPNLKDLHLCPDEVTGLEIFPAGFKWQERFPKLENFRFDLRTRNVQNFKKVHEGGSLSCAASSNESGFLRKYNFGSVPSVKLVDMQIDGFEVVGVNADGDNIYNLPVEFLYTISTLFPHAKFNYY